jgi:hypothetical protein
MKEESKCQSELVLKKIDKIKAFKEKVLRIKEEDFKNTSLNKLNINNIKIINKKSDKHHKKKKNKSEKHYKNNKLKLVTKGDLSLYLDKSESKKHSPRKYVKTKVKNDKPTSILLNVNDEIREERNAGKNSTSRKNIKTYRTVQLKPITKIQIDSNSHKNENNKNDNENSTRNKNDKQKKIEKQKEKLIEIEKKIEKQKEKLFGKESRNKTERLSRPKGLSVSLKNLNNTIKEEIKNEEEEQNYQKININIIDDIKVQKSSNSMSPDNRGSKSNNKNDNNTSNKPKFKPKEKKEYKLQYCVYPGNNYKLIDKVMEHRNKDWEKVPTTYSEFCDLCWAPLTNSINFQNCDSKHQYVNHLEFNNEISNKMRLYANLLKHCEDKKIDAFSIFPFTISLQISHRSFYEQLDNFEKLYKNIDLYTPKGNKTFSEMFNVILSKKIGSSQTINIPETFNSGKNIWIIKPVNLNRGRFITVEKNLSEILKKVEQIQNKKKIVADEKKKGSDIKCEYLILQKYLEKPLLYQGRKFDIRLWVLFIYNEPDDVYIFKQGHLKATCTQYNPDSNDLYVHLTNYSVQKYNENFSKIEIGNEIPFKSFQDELDKNNSGINFYKDIYPKIVRIVRITGGAAKGRINFLNRKYCFEIFGYDFILDEKYQPYLLEINTNPGLEISSPLIDELLPRMVDDALKLTIDKEFTKSLKYADEQSLFPVSGYDNKENMWDKYSII